MCSEASFGENQVVPVVAVTLFIKRLLVGLAGGEGVWPAHFLLLCVFVSALSYYLWVKVISDGSWNQTPTVNHNLRMTF